MGRAKIPRKRTNIDMTAMCDVAFLLLSFFILATKQKPPEAIAVQTPSSVSNKVPKDKAVVVTLTKDGKVFLMLDDENKAAIINDFNTTKGVQLDAGEKAKLAKSNVIGLPANKLKSGIDLNVEAAQMDGIPCADSASNELRDWMRSIKTVYADKGAKLELLVKGDMQSKYPIFRNMIDAFLDNDLTKFKLITNSIPVPAGSELARNPTGKDE